MSPGSTVVELLDPEPKINGSNPATGTFKVETAKKSLEGPYPEGNSAIFIRLSIHMVPYYNGTAHFLASHKSKTKLG